jgi:hypothetical protein
MRRFGHCELLVPNLVGDRFELRNQASSRCGRSLSGARRRQDLGHRRAAAALAAGFDLLRQSWHHHADRIQKRRRGRPVIAQSTRGSSQWPRRRRRPAEATRRRAYPGHGGQGKPQSSVAAARKAGSCLTETISNGMSSMSGAIASRPVTTKPRTSRSALSGRPSRPPAATLRSCSQVTRSVCLATGLFPLARKWSLISRATSAELSSHSATSRSPTPAVSPRARCGSACTYCRVRSRRSVGVRCNSRRCTGPFRGVRLRVAGERPGSSRSDGK